MIVFKNRIVALLAVALAAAPLAAQNPLPTAPNSRTVTISLPEHCGSEPAIAIDGTHPERLLAAYGGPYAAWSADSGRTFTIANGTRPPGSRGGGDVSVAFDDRGAAYLSYLTSEGLGTASYWAHHAGASGIWVRRSPDGGRTWEAQAAAVKVWPSPRDTAPQMVDMSRIWADASSSSPHHGNLYVAWINWELDKSIIQFSRSTDQGKTWSAPQRISTKAGLPRDDNGGLVAPIGIVGPDGVIYVIWNDLNSIVFTTSHDGGVTFARSRAVVAVGPPYFGGATGIPGVVRVMGFPQIGLDPIHRVLYTTWSDYRNGDVDVFISRSSNFGKSWSPPQRVNDDPIHDGKDQFFQWLAVDPVNGDVYVQFYDRRDDNANRKTRVTLARSTDRGKSFANFAWSDAPFSGDNVFLGDYSWLVAREGRVHGVWVEALPPDTARTQRRSCTVVKVGTADFNRPRP